MNDFRPPIKSPDYAAMARFGYLTDADINRYELAGHYGPNRQARAQAKKDIADKRKADRAEAKANKAADAESSSRREQNLLKDMSALIKELTAEQTLCTK